MCKVFKYRTYLVRIMMEVGMHIGERKYLYEYMPYWSLSLWYNADQKQDRKLHYPKRTQVRLWCIVPSVVATLASMLRWFWPNLECNLKSRDSQIWPLKRWPAYCGNVEGVGLKQNNQSTTHIDPHVGTGGMIRVYFQYGCLLYHLPAKTGSWKEPRAFDWLLKFVTQINIGKGGKLQAPACSVSGKGPNWCAMAFKGFRLNPHKLCSQLCPSQVRSKGMCHFHD